MRKRDRDRENKEILYTEREICGKRGKREISVVRGEQKESKIERER